MIGASGYCPASTRCIHHRLMIEYLGTVSQMDLLRMGRTAVDLIEVASTTFIPRRRFSEIEVLISFQHTVHSSICRKPSNGLIEICFWCIRYLDFKGSCKKLLSQSTVRHRLVTVLTTVAQIGLILPRVKQGDTPSPTLFAMCFNDLATGVKDLGCGVNVNDTQICILFYADDIVLIAPDENKLQFMLNFISDWCSKRRMVVNTEKT